MRTLLLSCLALPCLALSVTSCALPKDEAAKVEGQDYTYACADAKTFHVGFDEGFTYAVVTTGKATYKVPAVIAASGSRYTDEKVEFWEHHGEAMLNGVPGEAYSDCKQTEPPPG